MMQRAKRIQHSLFVNWNVISLPKLVLLVGPLVIVLIGILSLALQLNRQLSDQQQANLNVIANASIRNAAQLQRENLRLIALLNSVQTVTYDKELKLQRDLVNSRVLVLRNTLKVSGSSTEVKQVYTQVVQQWQVVDAAINEWSKQPQDQPLKSALAAQLNEQDRTINQLVIATQLHFEDRIMSWTNSARFINRLLTGASVSFLFIVLLMSYIIFLFFRTQSLNGRVLRRSERRLRAILDTIPDAVYRVDAQGTYLDYKPAKATLSQREAAGWRVGIAEREDEETTVIGKKLTEVLPAEWATLLSRSVQEVLASGQEKLLEYRLTGKESGTPRTFEARCIPGGIDEVQIIVRDITEAKQLEEASLQAQKLESLGVLAGGIAHDFNNLLTGMLGQISLAKAKLGRGLPALDHINKAVVSAERAADLTRQMLAYAGKGKFQIGPLKLNELIRDTAGLMGTALPSQAQLCLILDEALPPIQADRGQIQQVVMNLFINAIEALGGNEEKSSDAQALTPATNAPPRSDQIVISTSTITVEAGQPIYEHRSVGELPPGAYVVLNVTDTGVGMDETTRSRIFDPFFSTKPKGHGLGLSATMGIIRTHGGTLQVQSQPGQGTTFTVWLPALTTVVPASVSSTATPLLPHAKRQMVLVIDDEALIREAIIDILAEDGFTVSTAASGQEGIERFKAQQQQIGLILLDMKMPGMNGKQTYAELCALEPNLKVLFTSGDSEAEAATGAKTNGRVAFLPKPYSAEILMQQVHQMMAA